MFAYLYSFGYWMQFKVQRAYTSYKKKLPKAAAILYTQGK